VTPSNVRKEIHDRKADRNNIPVAVHIAAFSPMYLYPNPQRIDPTSGAKRRMVSMMS